MGPRPEHRRSSPRAEPIAPALAGDDPHEPQADSVAECRERVRLEQERAAAAPDLTERERHLDRAELWRALADLLVRDHAAALTVALEACPPGEAPDPELLAAYLSEASACGTA